MLLNSVTEVRLGQKTKVFASNRMPEHESLSFSLISADRTLDVICKDRDDYICWTTALRSLVGKHIDRSTMVTSMLGGGQAAGARQAKDSIVVEVSGNKAVVQRREDASDLYTWGEGGAGRLGHGDEENRLVPQVVEALLGKDMRVVACGTAHSAALTPEGRLFTWGRGASGRLGQGHERSRVTPLMVGALRDCVLTGLACGEAHTLALSASGEVYACGSGADSRLGFDCAKQASPSRVEALAGLQVVKVACGATCSAAVTADGKLYTWGDGASGILGHGSLNSETAPRLVETLASHTVTSVCLSDRHAAALIADGTLFTWGDGAGGKLGHGSETDVLVPTLVAGLTSVSDVALGANHTVCIARDGAVFAWGLSRNGQLGLGDLTIRPSPTLLPFVERARAVSCGSDHTALLTTDDRLYTWGLGLNGRLGHGDEADVRSPTLVAGLADKHVRAVICGGSHTAATVVHGWVDDDEMDKCMACKSTFTFVRRRHHCRRCGGLFCGACSSKKFPLISLGFTAAVRVCDKCHSIVSAEGGAKS